MLCDPMLCSVCSVMFCPCLFITEQNRTELAARTERGVVYILFNMVVICVVH